MLRSCRRMFSMFAMVHSRGWIRFLMAAFSAGSPNASKPTGMNTLSPRILRYRPNASVGVFTYQWPMWSDPDG